MPRLAIYDLDETITRRPTFARWLLFWGLRRAPWRLPLLAVQGLALLGYVAGWIDRRALKTLGMRLIMGARIPRMAVEHEAHAFAARELYTNIGPRALASIAVDRAEGRRLVLATASMDFYADAFAAALGFDATIATRSVWDADTLLPGEAGPNCHGPGKLSRIEAWLADRRTPRDAVHVRVYSDHISDLPSLAWADEAVAVNPSPELEAAARARGWRVERWR